MLFCHLVPHSLFSGCSCQETCPAPVSGTHLIQSLLLTSHGCWHGHLQPRARGAALLQVHALITVNSVVWYPGFNVGPAKEMLLQMLSALTAALVQCYLVIKGPALLGDAAA